MMKKLKINSYLTRRIAVNNDINDRSSDEFTLKQFPDFLSLFQLIHSFYPFPFAFCLFIKFCFVFLFIFFSLGKKPRDSPPLKSPKLEVVQNFRLHLEVLNSSFICYKYNIYLCIGHNKLL